MTICFWVNMSVVPGDNHFLQVSLPDGGVGEIIWILAKHCGNVPSMILNGFEKRIVWEIFPGQISAPM